MAMAPRALALILLTLMTAATSDARVHVVEDGYILVECHQAAPSSAPNRTDLHGLLVDLCFVVSQPSCAECLAASAKKIAQECGGSRCAGFWNAGCFVAYADSNASSPHEDAYRGRHFSADGVVTKPAFYNATELAALALSLAPLAANSTTGPMMPIADMTTGGKGTVHAVARCPRDVTEADCARCLEKSARELLDEGWGLDGRHEGVAVVEGFDCHLRLEIHAPDLPFGKMLLKWIKENIALLVLIVLAAVAVAMGVTVMVRLA